MKVKKAGIMMELGSTGLKRNRGTVMEEFLKELKGGRSVRVYREMADNDPIVNACLSATKYLLRQASCL